MNGFFKSLVMAFSTYSILPGSQKPATKENTRFILLFVPIVGVIIELLLVLGMKATPYLCNYTMLPAALCVVLPMILTKGSHVEGFVKTVDALCAHKPREKKMQILADSHGGYFAIIICISYFLIAVGTWSEMTTELDIVVPAMGFVLSRALFGLSILTLKHASESKCKMYVPDNAAKFIEIVVLALVALGSAGYMIKINPFVGGCCVIGAIVSYIYYWFVSKKHFGGITEDTAGFFLQVCEIVIPIVALLAFRRPISAFLAYEDLMM